MSKSIQTGRSMKKTDQKKSGIREYSESFFVALIIALVIRALVIYPFRIPTGSMQDSLLIGDFLLANKFVYGIRSPDWIGIPYTEIGFKIPFFHTPGFRKPARGDVVIFKYPKNQALNYIKRCIAVSGDTVFIQNKTVYVNGKTFPNAPKTKFIHNHTYPVGSKESKIFPPGAGNRDNYGPVRVPAPGDTFRFTNDSRGEWTKWLTVAFYEGYDLKLRHSGQTIKLNEKKIINKEDMIIVFVYFDLSEGDLFDQVFCIPVPDFLKLTKNKNKKNPKDRIFTAGLKRPDKSKFAKFMIEKRELANKIIEIMNKL